MTSRRELWYNSTNATQRNLNVKIRKSREAALLKLAYGMDATTWSPTVGMSDPPPTVGNVLDYIGAAQARGIGTPEERRDAFGRIIDSGLACTSPAGKALSMLGGGLLGRSIVGAFTNNGFLKGLGAGIGAAASARGF